MPAPLVKLPNSKEEYLLFVLENHKFNSVVSLLRWFYTKASKNINNRDVNRRMATWIRNNWSWIVKDFQIDDNKLLIEFSVNGILVGNEWSVNKDSGIKEERGLYEYAEKLYRDSI